MKILLTSLMAIITVITMTGCGGAVTTVPKMEPLANEAQVYFNRTAQLGNCFIGAALSPSITVDNKVMGEVPTCSHIVINMAEGTHNINMSAEIDRNFDMNVTAGNEYLVKLDSVPGLFSGNLIYEIITEPKKIREELSQTKSNNGTVIKPVGESDSGKNIE